MYAPDRRLSSFSVMAIGSGNSPDHDSDDFQQDKKLTEYRNPAFWLFGVANLLVGLTHMTGYFYLPKLAKETFHTSAENGDRLIFLLGCGSTLGRILAGSLADLFWTNPVLIFALGGMGSGIICALYPWAQSLWFLSILGTTHGLLMAFYICMQSISAIELMGIHNLNVSTGIVCFFYGVGSYLGMPLIGIVHDLSGKDYKISLAMAGAIFGAVSLISVFSYMLHKRTQNNPDKA